MVQNYSTNYIKEHLPISEVLRYYGVQAHNEKIGSWWCPIHEKEGRSKGHKSPSLVAKDEKGIATCMSKLCFNGDDIFGIIKKLEKIEDFNKIKKRACHIGKIKLDEIITSADVTEITYKHIEYLKTVGVKTESIRKYKLKSKGNYIIYPYIAGEKEIGYKGISVKKSEEEKSKFFFEGEKLDIWPEQNLNCNSHLIIVEGEKDAITLSQKLSECKSERSENYSITTLTTGALSIPQNIADKLRKYSFKKISIIYDNDETGEQGATKLYNTLLELNTDIETLQLPESNNGKKGYDISNYIQDQATFNDILNLKKTRLNTKAMEKTNTKNGTPEKIYPESKKSFQLFSDDYSIFDQSDGSLDSLYSRDHYLKDLQKSNLSLSTSISMGDYSLSIASSGITVIGAPTSHGKTLFLSNLTLDLIECNSSTNVLYISLEESMSDMITKFLNLYGSIDFSENNLEYIKDLLLKDHSGYLEKNGISFFEKQFLQKRDLFFEDILNQRLFVKYGVYDIESLCTSILFFNDRFNTQVVVIDYVQLISLNSMSNYKQSRTEELKVICQRLRSLCLQLNISVILSSQFNRQVLGKKDLSLVNLSESGDIERVASLVISLWKDKDYESSSSKKDSLEINILKNRNGPSNSHRIFKLEPNLHKVHLKEEINDDMIHTTTEVAETIYM